MTDTDKLPDQPQTIRDPETGTLVTTPTEFEPPREPKENDNADA